MAIEFVCGACGATLRVPDGTQGKVRCGKCRDVIDVPAATAAPVPPTDHAPREPRPPARTPSREPKRRPAAPPKSNAVLYAVVGCVLLLLTGGCVFLVWRAAAAPPNWRVHESAGGGYRIDLPAGPLSGMDKQLGMPPLQGGAVEGTVHRRTQYIVFWGDIQNRAWRTDDRILEDTYQGAIAGGKATRVVRGEPFTVGGFAARDLEMTMSDGETGVLRVIVAETRVYVLAAGGRGVDPKSSDVQRFLGSFEVTDPNILEVARRKAEAAEQARQRAEAEAQRRAEAARQEEERRAAARAAAEQARQEEAAAAAAKRRAATEAAASFVAAPPGVSAPDPTGVPGLELYISFDDAAGKGVRAHPVGQTLALPPGATTGPGVRGAAMYLPAGTAGVNLPNELLRAAAPNMEGTAAGWAKVREGSVSVLRGAVRDRFTARDRDLLAVGLGGDGTWGTVGTPTQPSVKEWRAHPDVTPLGTLRAEVTGSDRWHHVAIVRAAANAGDRTTLYLDGSPVAAFRFTTGRDEVESLSVGRTAAVTGAYPDLAAAAVDEVCYFNRALSAHEVRYLAGRAKSPEPVPEYRLAPVLSVEPSNRAVFDTKRGAVWMVADGDGKYKGAPPHLLRYTYPDFRLVGRWALEDRARRSVAPQPGRPVLDAANNRLYVSLGSHDTRAEFETPGRGVIHRYDLDDLPKSDPEAAAPKAVPAAWMKVVGGVSPAAANLTVSGDGKWLYFTDLDDKQVGTAEALPKPSPAVAFWVCRAPADLAGPVEGVWVEGNPRWSSALGLSADGKALHALQTGGRSVYPTGTLPSVKVIDTETWRTRETVPLPALKLNWQTPPHGAFHPDGRLFWSRGPAEVTEVTARAALRTRPTSAAPEAFLRVSADGRYLFIADAGTKWNRLVVLDARADAADLGELAVLEAGPGVPVGGPFAVSPDRKYVVFRSGLVVRLDEGEDARKPLPKRDPALESKK